MIACPTALQPLWSIVTRLGELQILLPVGLFAALVFALRHGAWRLAATWMSLLMVAMLITLASKLAFIGWGVGYAPLDFTGVSGHAMMAGAVVPLALVSVWPTRSWQARRGVAGIGLVLALLVGISRVVVGAHSWSEVLAGCLLGIMVTAIVVSRYGLPQARPSRSPLAAWWLPVVCLIGLSAVLAASSSFSSHTRITRLPLALAGHALPYTRADMARDFKRRSTTGARAGS